MHTTYGSYSIVSNIQSNVVKISITNPIAIPLRFNSDLLFFKNSVISIVVAHLTESEKVNLCILRNNIFYCRI